MNWLDVLLAAILGLSTASGLWKGFARIGIGLAATVLAFVLASWLHAPAGAWALPYTSSRSIAHLIGYLIVFFGVILAGAILGRVVAGIFRWIGLSWMDRLLGGTLGLLRGALIGVVIVLILSAFLPGDPPTPILESRIAPVLVDAAHLLSLSTPPEMKQQFRRTYEKVRKAWVEPVEKQWKRRTD
jgi:membrane protein required for colicin V production